MRQHATVVSQNEAMVGKKNEVIEAYLQSKPSLLRFPLQLQPVERTVIRDSIVERLHLQHARREFALDDTCGGGSIEQVSQTQQLYSQSKG
jgi:hypothetical protein